MKDSFQNVHMDRSIVYDSLFWNMIIQTVFETDAYNAKNTKYIQSKY